MSNKMIWIMFVILLIGSAFVFVVLKKNAVRNKVVTTPSGLQLYTEHFGDPKKTAVLLISGAMSSARFWIDSFCKQLADAGYFVIRYDHRDMGLSSAIDYDKQPYTLDDLAQDAIAILDAYKISKAHLIGHSMGGAISQLLALDYPERVSSITLISSSVLTSEAFTPEEQKQLEKTWQTLAEYNKPSIKFSESVAGFLKAYQYLHGDIPMDRTIAENYIKDMYMRTKLEHIAWFKKFSTGIAPKHNHVRAQLHVADRTQELNTIKVPVLIIHGEKDLLIFPRVIKEYCAAFIPQAKLIIVPGMGHMILNGKLFEQIGKRWLSCEKNRCK